MPGLSYPLETFVESLSDKGISDVIKVGRYWCCLGRTVGVNVDKAPGGSQIDQGGCLHSRGLPVPFD